jgi:hypothetical protein
MVILTWLRSLRGADGAAKSVQAVPVEPLLGLATDQPPSPPPVRKALNTIDIHITETIDQARLLPKAA